LKKEYIRTATSTGSIISDAHTTANLLSAASAAACKQRVHVNNNANSKQTKKHWKKEYIRTATSTGSIVSDAHTTANLLRAALAAARTAARFEVSAPKREGRRRASKMPAESTTP
jgi:hypothetical protein